MVKRPKLPSTVSAFANIAMVRVAKKVLSKSALAVVVAAWCKRCSRLDPASTLSPQAHVTIVMAKVNK